MPILPDLEAVDENDQSFPGYTPEEALQFTDWLEHDSRRSWPVSLGLIFSWLKNRQYVSLHELEQDFFTFFANMRQYYCVPGQKKQPHPVVNTVYALKREFTDQLNEIVSRLDEEDQPDEESMDVDEQKEAEPTVRAKRQRAT